MFKKFQNFSRKVVYEMSEQRQIIEPYYLYLSYLIIILLLFLPQQTLLQNFPEAAYIDLWEYRRIYWSLHL